MDKVGIMDTHKKGERCGHPWKIWRCLRKRRTNEGGLSMRFQNWNYGHPWKWIDMWTPMENYGNAG
jgi:hypothetical protein